MIRKFRVYLSVEWYDATQEFNHRGVSVEEAISDAIASAGTAELNQETNPPRKMRVWVEDAVEVRLP